MPPILTVPLLSLASLLDCFLTRSVVSMPWAAASSASGESSSFRTISGMPFMIFSTGRNLPMQPVLETKTSLTGQPSVSASLQAVALASSKPLSPVAALALPELTMTARNVPPLRCSLHKMTGAAQQRFCVKVAAAVAPFGQTRSVRSFFFSLMPQLMLAAMNPKGYRAPFFSFFFAILRTGLVDLFNFG